MRISTTLTSLILAMLISLSFPSVYGTAQDSQLTLAYRYGYLPFASYNLYLINPDGETQEEETIILPIAADDFVSDMAASPDGQWMAFVVGPEQNEAGSQIRLFNVLTREVRDRLVRSIFNGIAWSPNSRYLAVNLTDAEIGGINYATYIYDLQTNTDNYVLNGDFHRYGLSWSPDSTRLAVASSKCLQNFCQGQFDVVSVPNYDVTASTHYDTFGLICDLAWSPDNHYLSFVFSCLDSGWDDYIKDVFIWDTSTEFIQKVTAFTQNQDFNSLQNLDPSILFRNFYDIIWYDSNRLLVGVSGGQFKGGIGYDPASVQVQTNIYYPDGSSTPVSNRMLRNWVRNPVDNTVAFRSEEKVVYTDEYNMPQLRNQNVAIQVATLNGDPLQILQTQIINGCDLSWSPDGVYLAYSQRGSDLSDCWGSLETIDHFHFLNHSSGQSSQIEVSSIDPTWPGAWFAVATS